MGEHAEIDRLRNEGTSRSRDRCGDTLAARRRTYQREPVNVLERRLATALHPCHEQDQVLRTRLIDDAVLKCAV